MDLGQNKRNRTNGSDEVIPGADVSSTVENQREGSTETADVSKRRRLAPDQNSLLNNIPSCERYNFSYKTESTVTSISKALGGTVVISGHLSGSVKFWKQKIGKEEELHGQLALIKLFQPHTEPVRQLLVSNDGLKLVSIAEKDKSIMVFDLTSVDLIQVIKLDFVVNTETPVSNCWYQTNNIDMLLLGEHSSNQLYSVNPEHDEIIKLPVIHKFAITSIAFNRKYNCFISADIKGIIELWTPDSFQLPTVKFKLKSQTDLFQIVKNKSKICAIALTADNESFATISSPDNLIRVFRVDTGKVINTIDISSHFDHIKPQLLSYEESHLQEINRTTNLVFDKNDNVLLFSSVIGIVILDLQSNKILKVLGKEDSELISIRFNQFILLNKPSVENLSKEMIISDNKLINSQLSRKPILLLTALESPLMFAFSDYPVDVSSRDLDMTTGKVKKQKTFKYSQATLHTTVGDIKIKLFTKLAPKTVENFIGLCSNRYYNNVIFHRVIKLFMIQTGDPNGDGTGGDSLWGGHFEDEFNVLLTHSKPFMVSMANAGPNTNGSQFFITTDKCNHLDNKHSIFGEVVQGFDVVRAIEKVDTDDNDKPLDQIAILSVSLQQ